MVKVSCSTWKFCTLSVVLDLSLFSCTVRLPKGEMSDTKEARPLKKHKQGNIVYIKFETNDEVERLSFNDDEIKKECFLTYRGNCLKIRTIYTWQ